MGFTLRARNKKLKIKAIDFNAFLWPVMLQDTGMGYVLGYGEAIAPAQYVYLSGNNGSPVSNDGYKVSAFEAKAMAKIARGYISVKKYINTEWDKMEEQERIHKKNIAIDGRKIYVQPVGERFLNDLERFAEFAEQSNGFTIN